MASSIASLPSPTLPATGRRGLLRLAQALAALLVVARCLLPTEAAGEGATLWIAQLWPLAGLLMVAACIREPRALRRVGCDGFDVAVGVLAAGHVCSAGFVLATAGEQRAAMNLLWEWISLGLSFWILRRLLFTIEDAGRWLLLIVVTGSTIAGVGVWQREVFLPRAANEYVRLQRELEELQRLAPPTFAEQAHERGARIQRILREIAALQNSPAPLEGTTLKLWERRLRASTEPYGYFALANTLAGLLAVAILLAGGFLISSPPIGASRRLLARGVLVIAVVTMLLCIVLTKSRTAWVGMSGALGGAAVLWFRARQRSRPRCTDVGEAGAEIGSSDSPSTSAATKGERNHWRAVLAAAAVGLAGLGAYAGWRLDAQVLAESPKSLRYRFEYWRGAAGVIREQPWLGIGPGNFRAHYLAHKLPQSSEEIADPHNLLLDLWCSGGLLALFGFLWMMFLSVRSLSRSSLAGEEGSLASAEVPGTTSFESSRPGWLLDAVGFGGACSWLAVYLWAASFESHLDTEFIGGMPALGGLWLAVWLMLRPLCGHAPWLMCSAAAAMVALLVHLLGAGGIEMPAVVQILFLLIAASERLAAQPSTPGTATDSSPQPGAARAAIAGIICLGLFVGCWHTATKPVIRRQALIETAGSLKGSPSRFDDALRLYAEAADADRWSVEPQRQRADLHYRHWARTAIEAQFELGEATLLQVTGRNPRDVMAWQTLGAWRMRRFEVTGDRAEATAARPYYQRAVALYPHNARLLGETSLAASGAGDLRGARDWALKALEQDRINREHGHVDKYLTDEMRGQLQTQVDASGILQ